MKNVHALLTAGLCGAVCLLHTHCAGPRSGGAKRIDQPAWLEAPARRLTDSSADQTAPSFSPDGLQLVYQNNGDGNWELYTMQVSDGRPTRLTDTPEAEEDPSWSPDGRWIVCTVHAPSLDASPPRDILVMAADGRQRRIVAASGADDWHPRFSPDGKSIYFVSDRVDERRDLGDAERRTAVFRFDLESDNLVQLTGAGIYSSPLPTSQGLALRMGNHQLGWLENQDPSVLMVDSLRILGQPDWHAVAGWAVSEITVERDGLILVRPPQSNQWLPLGPEGREADQLPAWSPDGRRLAFAGRQSQQWDIYLKSMDGQP
ncbi:MAG: hypothetical protein Q8O14_05420 [bacterium]|jgi:TolB protein|nr:hypothetical protein [bacterium]